MKALFRGPQCSAMRHGRNRLSLAAYLFPPQVHCRLHCARASRARACMAPEPAAQNAGRAFGVEPVSGSKFRGYAVEQYLACAGGHILRGVAKAHDRDGVPLSNRPAKRQKSCVPEIMLARVNVDFVPGPLRSAVGGVMPGRGDDRRCSRSAALQASNSDALAQIRDTVTANGVERVWTFRQ